MRAKGVANTLVYLFIESTTFDPEGLETVWHENEVGTRRSTHELSGHTIKGLGSWFLYLMLCHRSAH